MSSSSLKEGVVEIKLGGETVELKATPDAAIRLSRLYSGVSPILAKLQALDLDAFINVVRYGANIKDSKALDELQEKIWKEGLTSLLVPLLEYVGILANGGKRYSVDDEEAGKTTEGKP